MASSTNNELIAKAQNAIEQIRPYLQADGGDIRFVETLKNGVEQAVRRTIPEIIAVEDINS